MTSRKVVNREAYPPEILAMIEAGRNHLISVANRWMMGWPERVQALIETGEYWEALYGQTEKEIDALAESKPKQVYNLAPWEIVEQAGLSLAPPVP